MPTPDPSSPLRDAAISVITLGELRAGVLRARDDSVRANRQLRFVAVHDAYEPIPVDENVAERYGAALARARSEGRATKATDLLIIATAAATGRGLITFDQAQAGLARRLRVPVEP